jgi:hypothetical protein
MVLIVHPKQHLPQVGYDLDDARVGAHRVG